MLSILRAACALFVLIGVGVTDPVSAQQQVSGGLAELVDDAAPEEPLRVGVGVKITQITGVDQKAENFGVVARVRMRWKDEALAFDAEELGRSIKTLSSDEFAKRGREYGVHIPVATIENQQSRSFVKSSVVTWFPDGTALFTEEIILTLQAPDFDFRRFPFDHQNFYFRIVANGPTNFLKFEPLAEASGLGDTLGEEEWLITDHWTEVDEVEGISGFTSSRFSLGFSAHRHLFYYWARIFVPVTLLIIIGWANLFLEEYRRRIDIATGNLLAFIAYNFTISGELPRLGYVTFIDALMMSVFILSVASVVYNVALRRLSMAGMEEKARAMDWHTTHWGYPLLFIGTVVVLRQIFFVDGALIPFL
ncbi:hypothetical protein R3X27_20055 [Tropicimonas sp. TH_r6]|uniref:hypothetical protein n=1 Tax=Tropicimonas sp. TH_r6 TaxID=3082085 RepID=UPI002953CF07|nr:hypothetical protein [Tropicimonas sp. TH_r6]MDV7144981.1 hypothetical protein [Tropicimonas sp. TH_r6]